MKENSYLAYLLSEKTYGDKIHVKFSIQFLTFHNIAQFIAIIYIPQLNLKGVCFSQESQTKSYRVLESTDERHDLDNGLDLHHVVYV